MNKKIKLKKLLSCHALPNFVLCWENLAVEALLDLGFGIEIEKVDYIIRRYTSNLIISFTIKIKLHYFQSTIVRKGIHLIQKNLEYT